MEITGQNTLVLQQNEEGILVHNFTLVFVLDKIYLHNNNWSWQFYFLIFQPLPAFEDRDFKSEYKSDEAIN